MNRKKAKRRKRRTAKLYAAGGQENGLTVGADEYVEVGPGAHLHKVVRARVITTEMQKVSIRSRAKEKKQGEQQREREIKRLRKKATDLIRYRDDKSEGCGPYVAAKLNAYEFNSCSDELPQPVGLRVAPCSVFASQLVPLLCSGIPLTHVSLSFLFVVVARVSCLVSIPRT